MRAASRRTRISACAVGSHDEIGWLYPRATIASSMTSTAPIGTSPAASASRACSSAASMNASCDIGENYHSGGNYLSTVDDAKVARAGSGDARLLVVACALLVAQGGADDAPE